MANSRSHSGGVSVVAADGVQTIPFATTDRGRGIGFVTDRRNVGWRVSISRFFVTDVRRGVSISVKVATAGVVVVGRVFLRADRSGGSGFGASAAVCEVDGFPVLVSLGRRVDDWMGSDAETAVPDDVFGVCYLPAGEERSVDER